MDIIKTKGKLNKNSNDERKNFLEQKYREGVYADNNDFAKNHYSKVEWRDKHGKDEEYLNYVSDNKKYQTDNFFDDNIKKIIKYFLLGFALVILVVGVYLFLKRGLEIKERVLGISDQAGNNTNLALENLKRQNFYSSGKKFNEAYHNFYDISKQLRELSLGSVFFIRYIPGVSKISSGYYLAKAGEQMALAGEKVSRLAEAFYNLKNDNKKREQQSLLKIFLTLNSELKNIQLNIEKAQEYLKKVKIDDLPEEKREQVLSLKNNIYLATSSINIFSENSAMIADLLGANGPRKYLFLFQNNQEMRATGGFIGTYGILSIDSYGRVQKFFVDGIFNPDGQLTDKIVPPKPIQKISVSWSLHDSNWFPDFPLSAKKAMLFYEKTGGPTVDGVIAVTPVVMQKLLAITGPIKMDKYNLVLTKDNFIENIQYEVEENYDKKENRPKKILADLTPIVFNKILSSDDPKILFKIMEVVERSLSEKQIILFSANDNLQKIISDLGWSGEILQTEKDYLNVVNTNINGYKTDGVIDETVNHQVDILDDGRVIDTLAITRKHNGGGKKYEWWNKVNADYMRVYVPKGSKFLGVEGQTREINKSPVDYDALGFERDSDVEREENSIRIDEKTGTRIYDEFGKTVFANWVYVSPQETVTIKYKYLLPFKINFTGDNPTSTYSVLIQKQLGGFGSDYNLQINYPKKYHLNWKSDELKKCSSSEENDKSYCLSAKLTTDKFYGLVISNFFK